MSATTNVTYYDLDAVAGEQVVITYKGAEYPLVPVSVDDFISNTRMINQLGDLGDDIEKALGLTKTLLKQAIPSMGADVLGKLSMTQMQKLVELCHKMNGQNDATKVAAAEAEKVTTENPPKAEK